MGSKKKRTASPLEEAARRADKTARRAREAADRAQRAAERAEQAAAEARAAGTVVSPVERDTSAMPPMEDTATREAGQAVLDVMASRRSLSAHGEAAPDDAELRRLLSAVVPVADHGGLRPWRLITLRGDDRLRLGRALAIADGRDGSAPHGKPLRAPLLIAIIVRHAPSRKVPIWEQEATAAGAAHLLSLALHAAGWTAFWRTGGLLDHPELRDLHGLADDEHLRGWLYIGARDPQRADGRAKRPDPDRMISPL